MVAEMESDALEQTHKLNEMLKKRDSGELKEEATLEATLDTSSVIGSQESEEEKVGVIVVNYIINYTIN